MNKDTIERIKYVRPLTTDIALGECFQSISLLDNDYHSGDIHIVDVQQPSHPKKWCLKKMCTIL